MPSDRKTLAREIQMLSEDVAGAFWEEPSAESRYIVGRGCPKPRGIPVAALRRLHGALRAFYAEALAAEDAALLTDDEREQRRLRSR